MERPGVANLEEIEVVTFPGEDGDGNSQADEDEPVAGADGPSAYVGGPPAAPPTPNRGGGEEDDDMPALLSCDNDNNDADPRPPMRVSARGNKGGTSHLLCDFRGSVGLYNPFLVKVIVERDRAAEVSEAIEAKLRKDVEHNDRQGALGDGLLPLHHSAWNLCSGCGRGEDVPCSLRSG